MSTLSAKISVNDPPSPSTPFPVTASAGAPVVYAYGDLVRVGAPSLAMSDAALPGYFVLSGSVLSDPSNPATANAVRLICVPQCMICGTSPPCVGQPDPSTLNPARIAIRRDAVVAADHIEFTGAPASRIVVLAPGGDLVAQLTAFRTQWGEQAQFVYHVYQLGTGLALAGLDGMCLAIPVVPEH